MGFPTLRFVNFRSFARKKALELGIVGKVRNVPNGTVEILAQGSNLNEFISHCRKGPPHAAIEDVAIEQIEEFKAEEFKILYQ